MKQPSHTILVVEDDDAIRESVQYFLEDEGYRVVLASNGLEALEKLEEIQCPCLIILDLFMPVMDGKGFLEKTKNKKVGKIFSIPVVLVSAAPPSSEEIREVKPMVEAYIKKPVDLDGFLNIVKQFCDNAA